MSTLKSLVSDGKLVHFQFYRKGDLWYKTDDGFEFAVPVSDAGDGKYTGGIKAEDSLITKENGFSKITMLEIGTSPHHAIDVMDAKYPDI